MPLFGTLTTRKCHAMCNDAHLKQCVQRAPSSAGGMWPLTEIRLHETSGLRPAPGPSRALHLQYLILECPIDAGAAMAGSGTPISETNNGHRWIGRSGVSPTYLRVISDCGGAGDTSINTGWRSQVAWLRVETLAFGVQQQPGLIPAHTYPHQLPPCPAGSGTASEKRQ